MKVRVKLQRLLLSLCLGLLVIAAGHTVCLAADETTGEGTPSPTPAPVAPVVVDYDGLWLKVDAKDNTTVYYSDKAKKVWSEAMEMKNDAGKYLIDISWLKASTATEITLKGDKNEEVVSVALPARESKYKVKFDKAKGVLTFTDLPAGVTQIQWRKATSYDWNVALIEDAKTEGSAFAKELEKLRIAGASIYVRIAGTASKVNADGTLESGTRPGKEIKITISKFANAPKVKVDGKKLTINTTNSMEYSKDGGTTWNLAKAKMTLQEVAPEVLGSNAKDTVIWVRKKATSRAPHSKTFALEIPAQRVAPTSADVTHESRDGKFWLKFVNASRTVPFEYAVVKSGELDVARASWKSVTTAKEISVSQKTAPAGSKIYVRKKTIKQSRTADFELASDTMEITVSY